MPKPASKKGGTRAFLRSVVALRVLLGVIGRWKAGKEKCNVRLVGLRDNISPRK